MTPPDPPKLIIRSDTGTQQIQLVDQPLWTVGRSQMNSICLSDPCASRHHAKIETVFDRHFCYVDLQSRNGSMINGHPVITPTLLQNGDRITIGSTEILFRRGIVTQAGNDTHQPQKQILTLQGAATQGIIWQELFLSHGISVIWETGETELLHHLRPQNANLPNLLLLDTEVFQQRLLEFCFWCRQQFPRMQIVLTYRETPHLSLDWQKQVAALGISCFLPAFDHHHLSTQTQVIQGRFNAVLQLISSSLNPETFHTTLKTLDQLLNQLSAVDKPAADPNPPSAPDPDEITSFLKMPSSPPPQRRQKHNN
ncbi:FHA domain-containing protein [Synechococcales cyanobacterium C]|uniref:FHA domain-containing protein n=1 Tax=Petrachloros mirabilis ULC683 TaxID=2781853 RepID=A0A8K2ANF6_9CYAN|nr:FHA domain-containing protein [Petrachloros mirabilis ULC683]